MPGRENEGEADQPRLDEVIPLSEAAELSGLSPNHLRLLVSRGEIWGKKIGRNWVTTAKAVREYVARERRPGPKPKKSTRPKLKND
ncbi:MAG: helix-turn-helix domain-containing protein [Nitrososphaera sp.]|nr:helix-turn-helix domain-containing protein [Nitrososphaera sp.]